MDGRVKKPIYKKWWFYIVLVLVIGGIGNALNDDTPKSAGQADASGGKEEKPKEKTEFSLGETISFKDFDLVISEKREITGITGEVYTIFDVSVTSKKDGFSFFGDFQGVNEDNEVISETIAFVSEDIGEPITIAFTKKLDKDQKAKGYLAFDKQITKLEVSSSYFSNKKIAINLE